MSEFSEKDVQREVTELQSKSATAFRLFDIRRIIGGLFVVYGIIVTIAGISPSDADLEKAQGVNINLWTGLAMLALGVFFLVWLKLRPTVPPVVDGRGRPPPRAVGVIPLCGAGVRWRTPASYGYSGWSGVKRSTGSVTRTARSDQILSWSRSVHAWTRTRTESGTWMPRNSRILRVISM